MKITDIKTYPINIEGGGAHLVIKVETDSGLYGWGCSGLTGRELAVVGLIKHFRGFLIGRDPRQIGAIWQELYRGQYFEGGRVITAAISGIDIALYDIKGKALGVPVYELLGGKQRDFVECFASIRFTTKEELLDYSTTCVKEGWKVLRLAPAEFESQEDKSRFEPRESIAKLSNWITELRKEVGSDIIIGVDYHTRLNVAETYSFMKRMPRGTIDFLEEPIRDQNPEAYQALRDMVRVPFAIGEEFSSKWEFMPFLENNIAQYARIDVCNVGGLTEAMKVAAMAETHYVDLMPHNPLGPICTAASIHLAAACPNFSYLEEVNTPAQYMGTDAPEFYPVRPQLDGPRYCISDTPGLGVEFNEKLAQEREFNMIDIPRLYRDDGSLTNW
ncbi:mandelate racemase/muconate lactonizing enzyme family protein [Maribacter algicola]|uniref:Mandelate racemase/muconate lactonizing enzyme family protein n=1 Tax=Maribacter algicola TaxID=2498892 RepID=A0A426RJ97_9FLAO|nr:mandelate racemase/muconate lactonizing enzyme family protein [Maribacter algicola]RRQ49032.1 mandelate racemase/muconate lactonizing enzyme family protein [Maribacter algicola]